MSDSDFDAAKTIADVLRGLEKERQQRVLRWVAESLEIALNVRISGAHFPDDHGHASSVTSAPTPETTAGRSVDIKSFAEAKRPKSDVQFATVVAYYYRFEASVDNVRRPESRRRAALLFERVKIGPFSSRHRPRER